MVNTSFIVSAGAASNLDARMRTETTLCLDRIDGKLGTLTGFRLEHRIHRDIPGTACRWLRLNRLRILQSLQVPRSPEFQDLIDDAEELGVITFDQGDHLEQTDIMLSARRRDNQRDRSRGDLIVPRHRQR